MSVSFRRSLPPVKFRYLGDRARPIYHRKRDSIEAHLTIVFAAPGGLPAPRCLRCCGLADRTRSGRDVLCQTSDLGLAFLDVAAI